MSAVIIVTLPDGSSGKRIVEHETVRLWDRLVEDHPMGGKRRKQAIRIQVSLVLTEMGVRGAEFVNIVEDEARRDFWWVRFGNQVVGNAHFTEEEAH